MTIQPETYPYQPEIKKKKVARYQRPKIIHEGQITTRAGTPVIPDGFQSTDAVDPADLFDND